MNVLFTGSSSFSGMWFAKELALAGHHLTAVFQHPLEQYTGIRRQRIDQLLPFCTPVFHSPFGEESFLSLISSQPHWDLFCHHAADVTNYKSPNFNVAAALAKNTNNLKAVCNTLKDRGCNKILLTGSIFEQNEGTGNTPLHAVSPYGLSKGLTSETFVFYATFFQMKLGKFVIPNPFGPFEEERFTTYLAKSWLKEEIANVNTPLYIRDNIPIGLLAKAYVKFASQLNEAPGLEKYNPSYFAESQGEFTHRFAAEMRRRLNVPCTFELKTQQDFNEPLIRINTDPLDCSKQVYNESLGWDELATYYKTHFSP